MKPTLVGTVTALALAGVLATAGFAQEKKDETKPETKLSGRVFADFSLKDYRIGDIKTNDSGYGIDVKRFYAGVAHTFDANWSASFVADIGDKGNTAACKPVQVDPDGTGELPPITIPCSVSGGDNKRYDVFAKNAYIQYKFSDAALLRLGAASNPWISYAEELYGQRYLEPLLIDHDRLKYGDSADWGVHFLGKTKDGLLNYALSAVNGLGYSDPKRTKGMDFEGRLGVQPIKGLNFGAGFYTGTRGKDLETAPAVNTAKRYDLLAAYVQEKFRVGVEWVTAENWNSVDKTLPQTEKMEGYSAYGRVEVAPKVELFARYDGAKPDKNNLPDAKYWYLNGGVQYKFNKAMTGALVYKDEAVETGVAAAKATAKEYGFFAEFRY